MTPAINLLRKQGIAHTLHEYPHDPAAGAYGSEAAEKLGIAPGRVFKTLVLSLEPPGLAVGLVPVSAKLSLKRIAKALGVKKAQMATQAEVERATGYVLGGVSPLGQKKRLKTVIDASAEDYASVYVSAGRRGLEIELSPEDLRALVGGVWAEIAQ